MRTSNKPTRGTPLSPEEKAEGERLRPNWWGGARYNRIPHRGRTRNGNGKRPTRAERGRSDWSGGNTRT